MSDTGECAEKWVENIHVLFIEQSLSCLKSISEVYLSSLTEYNVFNVVSEQAIWVVKYFKRLNL